MHLAGTRIHLEVQVLIRVVEQKFTGITTLLQ